MFITLGNCDGERTVLMSDLGTQKNFPASFGLFFILFYLLYRIKIAGFRGIQTRIVKVENEHTDH